MSAAQPIQVLIVDDHPIVREGLVAILSHRADMHVVGEAANGRQAIDAFALHHPDVTLMDLRMPDMMGLDAIRAIREIDHEARIIVLTTYDGDEEIFRSLSAGAKSFLLKDVPREQLLEVIRMVHSGQSHIPPGVAAKLAERMTSRQLTPRELEVLRHMASGKSNLEIGNHLFIAEGTVKAHVNSILSKLGVSDRTQAVTTGVRRGLVRLE
jgi:DNA-binding NarL/FixJ family response regulator